MIDIKGVFSILSDGNLLFYCPGCQETHQVWIKGGQSTWAWNGDYVKPTFTPSLLVRSGHYAQHGEGKECWCTHNAKMREEGKEESKFKCHVCHSIITDGNIQYLNDCSHELAGKTVAIPEWDSLFK